MIKWSKSTFSAFQAPYVYPRMQHIQKCNPGSRVTVLVAIVVMSWPQQYQDLELASSNLPRNQSQTKQTISNKQPDVSTQDLLV